MKTVEFLGDSKEQIRDFPEDARSQAGFQIYQVQRGNQPDNFKPMKTVGAGVEEIRIQDETGAYRVFYIARFNQAVYVLHAFTKKQKRTSPKDIAIGKDRYKKLMERRKKNG